MTTLTKLAYTFIFGLCSCSNNQSLNHSVGVDTPKIKTSQKSDTTRNISLTSNPATLPDTIKRFIVDDYPLRDRMFGRDINGRKIKSGNIFSMDKVWFTNDTLKQTIVVELYTDNFRGVEFHFQNNDIPKALIIRMELHTSDGELASQQLKQKNFQGFIRAATKIPRGYFTTYKNFKLGDSKQKSLRVYGVPDKKSIEDGVEVFEWDFVGDILYYGKTDLKGKPLANDSYGHQATMMFRNNKLIAIILNNDIP
jgi:hypothetical protein